MPEPNNEPGKKISGIAKLPEATRKKILIVSVSLITLILLAGWIKNFSTLIYLQAEKEPSPEFTELLENTKESVEQISIEVDKLKEATKILETIPTTTPEIDQTKINQLKEKILNQQSTSTNTKIDNNQETNSEPQTIFNE